MFLVCLYFKLFANDCIQIVSFFAPFIFNRNKTHTFFKLILNVTVFLHIYIYFLHSYCVSFLIIFMYIVLYIDNVLFFGLAQPTRQNVTKWNKSNKSNTEWFSSRSLLFNLCEKDEFFLVLGNCFYFVNHQIKFCNNLAA